MLKLIVTTSLLATALALTNQSHLKIYQEGMGLFGLFFLFAVIGGCGYCYFRFCRGGGGNHHGRNRGWFNDNSSDSSDQYHPHNSATTAEGRLLSTTPNSISTSSPTSPHAQPLQRPSPLRIQRHDPGSQPTALHPKLVRPRPLRPKTTKIKLWLLPLIHEIQRITQNNAQLPRPPRLPHNLPQPAQNSNQPGPAVPGDNDMPSLQLDINRQSEVFLHYVQVKVRVGGSGPFQRPTGSDRHHSTHQFLWLVLSYLQKYGMNDHSVICIQIMINLCTWHHSITAPRDLPLRWVALAVRYKLNFL